jgi:hypothetical protein
MNAADVDGEVSQRHDPVIGSPHDPSPVPQQQNQHGATEQFVGVVLSNMCGDNVS